MDTNQCIFNDDPCYMLSLIGKSIEITTTDNIYKGVVYVIDPESKTVVLANPCSDTSNYNLDFIMYSSILSLNVTEGVVNSNFLFANGNKINEDKEALEFKKARLKHWLEENLLDVQEDGDKLKLGEAVIIEYPYGPEECLCNNTIVLARVRKIIERMPSDYASK